MKTKIGQKAKSVLSLLLTVCMLLSVMSVGVASFGAAEADVAEDGAQVELSDTGDYTSRFSFVGDDTSWLTNKIDINRRNSNTNADVNTFYANIYITKDNKFSLYNGSDYYGPTNDSATTTISSLNYTKDSGYYKSSNWKFSVDSQVVRVVADQSRNNNDEWYPKVQLQAIDWYLGGYIDGENKNIANNTYKLTKESATRYTYTYTKTSNYTQYFTVNDGINCVYHPNSASNTEENGKEASSTVGIYSTSTENPKWQVSSVANEKVTVVWNPVAKTLSWEKHLPAPTNVKINNKASDELNAGSSTSTLSWDAVTNATSYHIYKNGTKVGESNTTSYSFTNAATSGGTYKVVAVPTSGSGYVKSDLSTSNAVLTVHSPYFSLVGDISTDYLSSSTVAVNDTNKWTKYESSMLIDDTTDTPGKYSITFTTKTVEQLQADTQSAKRTNINIGFLYNKDTQYGFRAGDKNYNTVGADLAVPDYGLDDSVDLYAVSGQGSLAFQPGRTYTITVDQTQSGQSGDKGKITITSTTDPSGFDLHYGTTEGNYAFGTYTDAFGNAVSQEGTSVAMVKDSAASKYTVKQRLTAGNTYYFYLTSPLAGQHTGVYFKNPSQTSPQAVTLGTSNSLWTYGGTSSKSWGDDNHRTLSLAVTETSNYIFTFDYSNPNNPTITVVNGDYNVTVEPKKKDFDPTARALKTVEDADAETFVVTANGSTTAGVDKNNVTPVTLDTAEVSGYTFKGWYTDAACTTPATLSGKKYTPDASVTLYALYEQDAPHDNQIRVTAPVGMDISADDGVAGDSSSYSAYTGATVTLSYNVTDTSKMFAGWDVKTAHGKKITVSDDNTFTMPNEAVIVTATIVDKPKAKVNVSTRGKDDAGKDLGTAVQTTPDAGANIYIGETEITLTATPKSGYVFKGWTLDGAKLTTTDPAQSLSNATITVKADSATVNAVASFDYKEYQVSVNGNTIPMQRQTSGDYAGKYISLGTVPRDTTSNGYDSAKRFTIYDVSEKKHYFHTGNNCYWIMDNDFKNNESATAANGDFPLKPYTNHLTSDAFVIFDPDFSSPTVYGKVKLVTTSPFEGTLANVYTKEGTIRTKDSSLYTEDGDVTAAFAQYTKITNINGTEVTALPKGMYATNYGHQYSIPKGSTITVETKLTDTMKNEHWYVSHFVVNGWKVSATKMKDGVYTATFDIGDDYATTKTTAISNAYEITPVLYNSDIEADGGYVTFYVDADYVPDLWETDTLAVQGFWDGATKSHFTGTYPGVPMARVGKYYEIKIPLYYYSKSGDVMVKDSAHPVSSVTISAYTADIVNYTIKYNTSTSFWDNNKNFQTYDYGDFKVLSQIPNIQSIMFRPMYETGYGNNSDADGNWDLEGTQNTYHLLTDYYGRPIDLLGNVLTLPEGKTVENLTASDAGVKVVSIGDWDNQNTSGTYTPTVYGLNGFDTGTNLPNTRTEGHWATRWRAFVKNASGTFERAAIGTQSDFINTTPGTEDTTLGVLYYSDDKRTEYSASDLANKITYVSYEGEYHQQRTYSMKDSGRRIDGQWYYSSLGNEFNSTVEVGYMGAQATSVTGANVTQDANSNAENTGWIGDTTKTKATLDAKTTATYTNVTTNAALNVSVGSGYTFVGWYLKEGTGNAAKYTKIGDNYKDLSTTFLMNNTYTFVAVVKAVPSGSLVITHNKYTGKTPHAHTGGIAKYYVSAKVIHNDDSVETIPEAQNSITVPGLASTDKIQITLRTKCSGDDEFYAWYEEVLGDNYSPTGVFYEICDEQSDKAGEKEASYEFFPADCAKFFKDGQLKRKSLDFYSDIVHVSASAKLTYQYYDRFNVKTGGISATPKRVEYVVDNVELSVDEIENGYRPSDETIAKYAPKIVDTLYVDTKWIIDSNTVEKNKANALITATQELKDCAVQYVDPTNIASLLEGNTELAPADYGDWINEDVPFNSLLAVEGTTLENYTDDSFYVNAPQQITVGDKTWNFVRFDVYSYNSDTAEFGDILYSSNDHIFEYRIYADCAIYPVYTTDSVTPELTATIQAPIFNREVYTNDLGNLVDRLYADMLVGYINTSSIPGVPEIIKDNKSATSGYEIETGTLVDYHLNLTDADYATLSNAGKAKTTDTTDSILAGYTDAYSREQLTDFLKGTADLENVRKTVISADKLTNKNRVDQVYRYSNTEKNQKSIFIVYSYVMITKKSTGEKTIAISMKPQIYNFAYYGNRPLVNE